MQNDALLAVPQRSESCVVQMWLVTIVFPTIVHASCTFVTVTLFWRALTTIQLTLMHISFHTGMLETLLTPIDHCICPSANYTCVVQSATVISWKTVGEYEFMHTQSSSKDEVYFEEGGYQVTITRGPGRTNFSSSLHIRDLGLNGTNLTCEAFIGSVDGEPETLANTTTVCVVGI